MVMKQTAVEWLISHLQKSKDWQRVLNEVSQMSTIQSDILNLAKEMEKEQIINTFKHAQVLHAMNDQMRGEQFYNETFKSE
jgi:hypothetical protein